MKQTTETQDSINIFKRKFLALLQHISYGYIRNVIKSLTWNILQINTISMAFEITPDEISFNFLIQQFRNFPIYSFCKYMYKEIV